VRTLTVILPISQDLELSVRTFLATQFPTIDGIDFRRDDCVDHPRAVQLTNEAPGELVEIDAALFREFST
jgi:hypothetical protein